MCDAQIYKEMPIMDIIDDLSLTNYIAVTILERLGVDPSQEQIDIIESLILMLAYPQAVDSDTIKQCIGNDKLAYYFLCFRNKELRRR